MRFTLLLCAAAALAAAAFAADERSNATPDFGVVNVTWTPGSSGDEGATLVLTMDAAVLGSLPLGVGRTQLTLLADSVELPQARQPRHGGGG
jgi:hypothetical protein